MPIFYQAGSIIPSQGPVQYVDTAALEALRLDIYAGSDAAFDLYDDDGRSLDYQAGEYTVTAIRYQETEAGATLQLEETESGYALPQRTYVVRLHTEQLFERVDVNGAAFDDWRYDQQAQVLTVRLDKAPGEKLTVHLR
jgi:alpha-glucosidase (family GH31 glycosyl hydrolase)